MSKLIAAVVAIYKAETNVTEKRTAAALAFRDAVNAEGKNVDLRKFNGAQAKLAQAAIVKASGLADAYEAMDKAARDEYKKSAGKADPLAVLIRTVDNQPARFSEYARIYKLAKLGNPFALGVYEGEFSLNEALELLADEGRESKGETKGEGNGVAEGETEGAEGESLDVEARFLRTVLKYMNEGLSVERMAEIMATAVKTGATK